MIEATPNPAPTATRPGPFVRIGRVLSWALLSPTHGGAPVSRMVQILTPLVIFLSALALSGFNPAPSGVVIDAAGNHPLRSFEIAFNWSHCGVRPYLSSHPGAIRNQFGNSNSALTIPASAMPALVTGNAADYCTTVDLPFLNNENALGLLMFAALELWPDLTLNDLGQYLRALALAALALWLVLALRLGLAPLPALVALMTALELEAFQWTYEAHAVYPLLLPMALLFGAGLVVLVRAVAQRRLWTFLAMAAITGLMAGFYYDLRTSHAPLIAAGLGLSLWLGWRAAVTAAPDRAAMKRGTARLGILVALALVGGGLLTSHRAALASAVQFAGRDQMYPNHLIAHPVVLSLALPPNPFAQSQGIHWLDRVGQDLARRVDPDAVYLGSTYETALWKYYRDLWRDHPREMAGIYLLKWQTAGREPLGYIRTQKTMAFAAIQPIRWLYNGIGVALAWAGIMTWALSARRPDPAVALGVALTAAFGLLLLVESAMIYSTWNPFYHAPLVFALALSLLCLYQWSLNRVACIFRRFVGKPNEAARQAITDLDTQ